MGNFRVFFGGEGGVVVKFLFRKQICLIFLFQFSFQAGLILEHDDERPPKKQPLEKIELKHLLLPFIILGIGLSLATLVFLCELLFKFLQK